MSGLSETQSEWIGLFHRLRPEFTDLGAPFLSVNPAGYEPINIPSVLYVGKATKDAWYLDEFLEAGTVQERHERTKAVLKSVLKEVEKEGYKTSFWDFALNLSARLAKSNSNTIQPLQNLIWTNISKIAVHGGNPGAALRRAQYDLSLRTLKLEIAEYRPRLIVFVTNAYEEKIVGEIADDPDKTGWSYKKNDWHWWRRANGDVPAILWTGHPQGKTKDTLERWLTKCVDLVN